MTYQRKLKLIKSIIYNYVFVITIDKLLASYKINSKKVGIDKCFINVLNCFFIFIPT
jgi:hypothetical protein